MTPTRQLLESLSHLSTLKWVKNAIPLVKTVKIVPSKSLKIKHLNRVHPKVKECYLNALAVCTQNREVEYIEGFIEVHGVPLEHAWNRYQGQDFDLTEEELNHGTCPHRAIMVVPASEVCAMAVETEISGPYLIRWIEHQK